MKILEYGHIKPITEKCTGCGAVLEIAQADIKEWHPGTTNYKSYYKCPICGKANDI